MKTRLLVTVIILAAVLVAGCASGTDEPVVVTPEPTGSTEPTGSAEPTPTALADITVDFKLVADGFTQPLFATGAGDGSGRLFAVEKTGRIWILRGAAKSTKPFLDLSTAVSTNSERGLLGLAFSTSFAEDGLFYVNYTDKDGTTTVSRFTASGDTASRDSEQVLLKIKQPYANHNGGMIAFGPDGYLYVGMGDGGSGGDPKGNGQNMKALLGKMLRIDVSRDASEVRDTEYGIPASNPYAGSSGVSREIWASGLRNPWRFSFDRTTGDLWIGDVGQGEWEEIDFQPAGSAGGENYGWNAFEGTHPYPPGSSARAGEFTAPIVEYGHKAGESVTGGYVYRGTEYPALQGVYVYADYVSGRVWGLKRSGTSVENRELADTAYAVVSFGEDDQGELYMVDFNGGVYRVMAE